MDGTHSRLKRRIGSLQIEGTYHKLEKRPGGLQMEGTYTLV